MPGRTSPSIHLICSRSKNKRPIQNKMSSSSKDALVAARGAKKRTLSQAWEGPPLRGVDVSVASELRNAASRYSFPPAEIRLGFVGDCKTFPPAPGVMQHLKTMPGAPTFSWYAQALPDHSLASLVTLGSFQEPAVTAPKYVKFGRELLAKNKSGAYGISTDPIEVDIVVCHAAALGSLSDTVAAMKPKIVLAFDDKTASTCR